MAAQTIFVRGSDAHHGRSSASTSLPYPPAPPSPTLTNPDMILPDYERSDSPDDRSQSPIMLWNNGQFSDLQFNLPPHNAFVAGPITPTTPIIYGNGTMLSDIGEVTEVESTVGRQAASRMSDRSDDDVVLPRSAITGASRIKTRSQVLAHSRRSSIESTSTIGRGATLTDFDDSVSVDDSNFQGDDEESMASAYVEGTAAREPTTTYRTRSGVQRPTDDRYSTNSLSQRAEEILANAKRRLTTMEGNLSRARSSLSQSSMSDTSTPSPPLVRPMTALRNPSLSTAGHSRNLSETGVSTSTGLLNGIKSPSFPQRSASALGAAGGYRQPLTPSKSADAIGGKTSRKSSLNPLDTTLELANEEDANLGSRRSSSNFQPLLSPTFGAYSEKGLTRSASVAQMRDIKDQMNDLKGKISNLKEQARADSLKRRSLQSLRTPSPFTHARWDQGHMEPQGIKKSPELGNGLLQLPEGAEMAPEQPILNGEQFAVQAEEKPPTDEDEQSEMSAFEEAREQLTPQPSPFGLGISQLPPPQHDSELSTDDDVDDMRTENGDVEEEEQWEQAEEQIAAHESEGTDIADSEYESESGESLYHESIQNPVSHEDREDAFDYEHFFLHSAMGTLSQKKLGRRSSASSLSSEDSVETTKGPITNRPRRASLDSIASFDSFATANEERLSRSSTSQGGRGADPNGSSSGSSSGPPSARQSTFDVSSYSRSQSAANHHSQSRRGSVIHRPASSAAVALHRPSNSSLGSAGTNRSFPLVNKARMSGGILTPGGSPDHELKEISESLMNETASICDNDEASGTMGQSMTMQMLSRDDQILVEGLVASLGKCVLGLSEVSRAGTESRAYRRRMDAARRILEGLDE